jgi:hypothetical protein
MTETQIENVWRQYVLPVYNKNERHRLYAITPASKRQLVALYRACSDSTDSTEQAQELFRWSLERFTECGINVLQPPPPSELEPPKMWLDLWGKPLANPFLSKDVRAQTLVVQRDPMLAKWLKKFAADPFGAVCGWQDEQANNLKQRTTKYDGDTHAGNPYVRGFTNETERGRFEREHPDLVEQLKREAIPVAFPTGEAFNLTLQGRIAKNPKLNALAAGMRRHEVQDIQEARTAAKEAREKAEQEIKKLEAQIA